MNYKVRVSTCIQRKDRFYETAVINLSIPWNAKFSTDSPTLYC